jgi:hypothetical protein
MSSLIDLKTGHQSNSIRTLDLNLRTKSDLPLSESKKAYYYKLNLTPVNIRMKQMISKEGEELEAEKRKRRIKSLVKRRLRVDFEKSQAENKEKSSSYNFLSNNTSEQEKLYYEVILKKLIGDVDSSNESNSPHRSDLANDTSHLYKDSANNAASPVRVEAQALERAVTNFLKEKQGDQVSRSFNADKTHSFSESS